METEEWRPVVGYEGVYEVSDRGRVRSLPRTDARGRWRKGCVLRPGISGGGYLQVNLWIDRGHVPRKVHHLVLGAFVGPRPDGHETNHKNGRKADNALTNLEYVTPSANVRHANAMGLVHRRHGSAHHNAKLSEEAVQEIRRLRGVETQESLAARFGVTHGLVGQIQRGLSWAHMEGEDPTSGLRRGEGHPQAKLVESDVRKIMSAKGRERAADLATRFGVSLMTVYLIWQGKRWRHLTYQQT